MLLLRFTDDILAVLTRLRAPPCDQQVLDELEVSGRVSTFPCCGRSNIWFTSDVAKLADGDPTFPKCFFSRLCSYVYERTCHTKPIKEQLQSYSGRLLNLGTLKEAFKTRSGAVGRDTQGLFAQSALATPPRHASTQWAATGCDIASAIALLRHRREP